jgi:hypothetical protein
MNKVVKLSEPLKSLDKREFTQLVFRPLIAGDWVGIDMARFGVSGYPAEDCIRLIANNSETPLDVVHRLPNDKFQESIGILLDFIAGPSQQLSSEGSTSETGESSSPALDANSPASEPTG